MINGSEPVYSSFRFGALGTQWEIATGEPLDDALRQLRESLDQAFTALGDAVRDPQFGEQTKKAAGSLSDAMSTTFAEVSERFRSKREPPPGPGGPGEGSGPQEQRGGTPPR